MTLFLRVALEQAVASSAIPQYDEACGAVGQLLALPAPPPRYALGADGAGAARPGACCEPDPPPRATRPALGAEGAARLCAGRGSRWLPSPLAAIAASRCALGADGVGAAHPGVCGSLGGASR